MTAVTATAVVFGVSAQQVTAATAGITLTPSVGPPNTGATVKGTGFGAHEVVDIDFDAVQVASARTLANGSFSRRFTVPKAALPGEHPVRATGQTSGRSAAQDFLVQANWAMGRYGPANNAFNPYENVVGVSNVSGLTRAWTGPANSEEGSSPVVDGGVLYVADNSQLNAFSANGTTNCSGTPRTCTPLWTAPVESGIGLSSPAVADGVVYIGSTADVLFAFSANGTTNCSGTPRTCTPLWTGALSCCGTTEGASSPVVADGVVYIGDDEVYGFSADGRTNCSGTPKTCTPIWIGLTDSDVFTPPAVSNGVVYATSSADTLSAFSAAGTTNCSGTPTTCRPLWTAGTDGAGSNSAAAVADGMVYVGSDIGGYLIDAYSAAGTTGCSGTPKVCAPLWAARGVSGEASGASPAVANGVVYMSNDIGGVYAFDALGATNCSGTPKVCKPLWHGHTGVIGTTSLAVANGVLYQPVGHNLDAFSAAGTTNCSGTPTVCTPLWVGTTSGTDLAAPAVANGIVYSSSFTAIYAFSG